ncbi:MAG: mannose-1-phosphate guanylyltransferase [Candidatus Marinimicrobia bacterium]|nr:mannose-1-phosphate guanylyltransferase [bacterium]MCG2716691.1 mannose-1-phosphate guanylyltransferase [Candidatus Neomarinimicrobiota bacterium]
MYAVIMAGGVGKRFWPRSCKERPKQLLDIVSDQSMLKLTYERLKKVTDEKKIFIVAGQCLYEPILRELPDLPVKNLIIEPSGKNTAPCIGLAATTIIQKDPNAVLGIFPADHLIVDENSFRKAVHRGVQFARDHVALVTFGIMPTRPATGYGYIQYSRKGTVYQEAIYKVKTFAEKPNLPTAKRFLESGEFLWNSGMFIWKADNILNSIKLFLPELHESLQAIAGAMDTPQYTKVLKKQWASIHSESIDYGVMEKAKNVYVVRSTFDWNDVGSWDAVYEIKEKDKNGNVIIGDVVTMNTENSYIYSRKNLISTIGVKDLIIIQSKNAILIVNRNESEKVKDLVDLLERKNHNEHI